MSRGKTTTEEMFLATSVRELRAFAEFRSSSHVSTVTTKLQEFAMAWASDPPRGPGLWLHANAPPPMEEVQARERSGPSLTSLAQPWIPTAVVALSHQDSVTLSYQTKPVPRLQAKGLSNVCA